MIPCVASRPACSYMPLKPRDRLFPIPRAICSYVPLIRGIAPRITATIPITIAVDEKLLKIKVN